MSAREADRRRRRGEGLEASVQLETNHRSVSGGGRSSHTADDENQRFLRLIYGFSGGIPRKITIVGQFTVPTAVNTGIIVSIIDLFAAIVCAAEPVPGITRKHYISIYDDSG